MSDFSEIKRREGEPDKVSVTFTGDAVKVLEDIKERLANAESREAVVLAAVELLYSALGKEVLLRDGNRTEVYRLWKEQ